MSYLHRFKHLRAPGATLRRRSRHVPMYVPMPRAHCGRIERSKRVTRNSHCTGLEPARLNQHAHREFLGLDPSEQDPINGVGGVEAVALSPDTGTGLYIHARLAGPISLRKQLHFSIRRSGSCRMPFAETHSGFCWMRLA